MMKQFSLTTTINQAAPIFGAAALSGLAFFGMPGIAEAAAECGPGDNWVEDCEAGIDKFGYSTAILDLWLYNPDGSKTEKTVVLNGPFTVERQEAVDFIENDLDYDGVNIGFGPGTFGIQNEHDGVIKTILKEEFTGNGISLIGTGIGAIIEATEYGIDRPDLAYSFFNVFAEITGDFGKAMNQAPITVFGDSWLTGVSPTAPGVSPISGGGAPALPIPPEEFNFDLNACQETDPLAVIIYCGFQEVDFFLVDDNGDFQLDAQGKEIKIATLHSERHVADVPEPLTTLASVTGLAFGGMLKRKNDKKNKKQQKA